MSRSHLPLIFTMTLWLLRWGVALGDDVSQDIAAFSGVKGNSVALSADGGIAAIGGHTMDGDEFLAVARAVTLPSGKESFNLVRRDALVHAIAMTRDGQRLAVSFRSDKEIELGLWNLKTGERSAILQSAADREMDAIQFSPDGTTLAGATHDVAGKPVLVLWDTASFKKTRLLYGHTRTIWSVSFSADGKLLASAASDKIAKVWDVKTGEVAWTIDGNPDTVDEIAFNPESRTVAYECGDAVHVVHLGDPLRRRLLAKREAVTSLAFHSDGKHLFCGGFDREPGGRAVATVQVWDAAGGKMVSETRATPSLPVTSFASSSKGDRILTTSHDGVTRIWKLEKGRLFKDSLK